jgi:outer membrane protein TolC
VLLQKNSAELSRIQYVTKAKQAYDDLLTSSLRVDASQQAVKEAENVSLVIKTVSAIGITDFTQQVQSIELYANAVLELASAVRDVNIAQINLYRYTSTLPIGMLSLPLLPIKK